VETPAPEQPKPPAATPVAAQAPKPETAPAAASATEHPLQIVTSPPGADIILDNDPAKTCKSPCSFDVTPGRHTLAATLQGYRRELRITEVSQRPQELFVNLTRAMGVVMISTDVPGADILIDGKPIPEKTPAKLSLPAGKHTVSVLRNGRRTDQEIEVKDGGLLNFALQLNP
jgi:hypothetical protein